MRVLVPLVVQASAVQRMDTDCLPADRVVDMLAMGKLVVHYRAVA